MDGTCERFLQSTAARRAMLGKLDEVAVLVGQRSWQERFCFFPRKRRF